MSIKEAKELSTYRDDEQNGRLIELFTHNGNTEVYLSTISPGKFKGWHKHTKKDMRFHVIKGEMMLMLVDDNNIKTDRWITADIPQEIFIEHGNAIGMRNTGDEECWVVCYPEYPYKPEEDEMVTIEFEYEV